MDASGLVEAARGYARPVDGDADLASIGAALCDPARAAMLTALMGGRTLPAGELARIARVAPSTAGSHPAQLSSAGLVAVERHSRHCYHRLAGAEIAHALEALAAVAPASRVGSLRAERQTAAERATRSCHDHLAGALGVALTDWLVELGALDFRLARAGRPRARRRGRRARGRSSRQPAAAHPGLPGLE